MGGVLGPGGGCDFCPRVIHPHLGCYLRRLGLVKIYIYIYIFITYILGPNRAAGNQNVHTSRFGSCFSSQNCRKSLPQTVGVFSMLPNSQNAVYSNNQEELRF